MMTRGPRRRSLGFESLERRENPSNFFAAFTHKPPSPNIGPGGHPLTPPHQVSPMVTTHHEVVPLSGRSQAFLVQQTRLPNGYTSIVANLAGRSNRLGQFTGQATPAIAPDGSGFLGSTTLYSQEGSYLSLSLVGTVPPATRGRFTHFNAAFTVVGGTGTFAGASGSGTIAGFFDPRHKTGSLTIHGALNLVVTGP